MFAFALRYLQAITSHFGEMETANANDVLPTGIMKGSVASVPLVAY